MRKCELHWIYSRNIKMNTGVKIYVDIYFSVMIPLKIAFYKLFNLLLLLKKIEIVIHTHFLVYYEIQEAHSIL